MERGGAEGPRGLGRGREGAPRRGALRRAALPGPPLRHMRRRSRRRRHQEDRQERRQVPGAAGTIQGRRLMTNDTVDSASLTLLRWLIGRCLLEPARYMN